MEYHSFVRPSFISTLWLVLLLSLAISSYSTRTVQVSDICSKHGNPSYCASVLNSVPGGAAGADLGKLAQYTINTAHVNAFDSLALIHTLIGQTGDPQLKQHYQSCSENYNDALLGLNQAEKSFSSGDYNGMNSSGAAVMKDAGDCDSKPPADPSSLPQRNKDLEDLSMIIMILADFLAGKYISLNM